MFCASFLVLKKRWRRFPVSESDGGTETTQDASPAALRDMDSFGFRRPIGGTLGIDDINSVAN